MNPTYRICWNLTRGTLSALFGLEGHGKEHLPKDGGFLLAANHVSFLDPLAIGACINFEVHYFARSSLFRGPLAPLLPRVRAIPVDRDGGSDVRSIRMALSVLKSGSGLLIFPEGTRSPDGSLQPGQRGVGLLAARAGVPVVPCRIYGSHGALPRDQVLPRFGVPLSVVFGPPVPCAEIDPGKQHPERYEEAARRIMAAITSIGLPPQSAV